MIFFICCCNLWKKCGFYYCILSISQRFCGKFWLCFFISGCILLLFLLLCGNFLTLMLQVPQLLCACWASLSDYSVNSGSLYFILGFSSLFSYFLLVLVCFFESVSCFVGWGSLNFTIKPRQPWASSNLTFFASQGLGAQARASKPNIKFYLMKMEVGF